MNTSSVDGEKERNNQTSSDRPANSSKTDEDYGYSYYPNRDGAPKKSFWNALWQGRSAYDHSRCESNVIWCVENHPMVKLFMRALKSHGCEVNLSRHVSCEPCLGAVSGGFDPSNNQVVICENTSRRRSTCCNILSHEFLHAFDKCRAKVDFKDLKHLACTEIRAANIMHCSFLAAWSSQDVSPFNMLKKHGDCVKSKALLSILMVRNVSTQEAMSVVDSVFDKCYNDLEPVGRRPIKGTRDRERALQEGHLYGYS